MPDTPPLRIGVLALQGDYDAHAAALHQASSESGIPAATVLVRKPAQLADLDGLILPGGESTTFLKFLERDGFLADLQTFVAATPTFGTCAGTILLAKQVSDPPQPSLAVLDATVQRNAYGRQNDSSIEQTATTLPGNHAEAGAEAGLRPEPFIEAVYIRAPRITRVGAGVTVLAEREGFPVLVEQGHLLAATFHPELSADRRVHAHFLRMVAAHLAAQPRSTDAR
ncbi:MAG TPA: pyridoxal 5'-phosphate synthase glutaminase subunit PdxT [Acidobacteriaceae bacterium]